MTTLHIEARYVSALALFCGKLDKVRPYLGGIWFEIGATESRLVASNGHMLAVLRVKREPSGLTTPIRDLIIPLDLFKMVKPEGEVKIEIGQKITKHAFTGREYESKSRPVNIIYNGITISGESMNISPPDWRKIIPAQVSGETAQFNPHYIATLGKTHVVLGGRKTSPGVYIGHNGSGPAIVRFDKEGDFFAIIMPVRKEAPESLPEWWNKEVE